jgi:nucleotide-binding universal stress UspA family protein
VYKRILVATDGSELSQRAVQSALQLAKSFGVDLIAVRVMLSPADIRLGSFSLTELPAAVHQGLVQAADRDLDWVRQEAERAGVPCRALRVEAPQPWKGLIATAETEGCDLIVMARYGRHGWSDPLIGSETQKVLTHSKIDVLVHH